ncbi:uncharacterized protein LOC142589012 [Dermacentor variabilis]|uniref:uncharacterized protein LOC142589012 n=1 Tax=Dermacentor variabilis TaxID=34621 RepID=UPI003F5B8D13
MTGVRKISMLLMALTAAWQQCNASDGDDGTRNELKRFWSNNEAVLVYRTTYGLSTQCQWYSRENYNDTGVTLKTARFSHSIKMMLPTVFSCEYWTFEESNSTSCLDVSDKNNSMCRDGPYTELLVNEDNMNNVPAECTKFYEKEIHGKQENNIKDMQKCMFIREPTTTRLR